MIYWGNNIIGHGKTLRCYYIGLKYLFEIHFHIGHSMDAPDGPRFRLRGFWIFGRQVPFFKYYVV